MSKRSSRAARRRAGSPFPSQDLPSTRAELCGVREGDACEDRAGIYVPGGRNEMERWGSISDAVASGRPFFVPVREDLLVVDQDDPAKAGTLLDFKRELEAQGLKPVLVASGQAGHHHLFARCTPRWRLDLESRARELGLDVRRGSRAIRPPFAPHRLGGHSFVLEPDDVEEALARLTAPGLPAWVQDLLDHGVPRGQRSDHLLRVAAAFARAGFSEDAFVDKVRPSPLNKFARRADEEKMLRKIYRDADGFVRDHWESPGSTWVERYWLAAQGPHRWQGRHWDRDRRVYLALLACYPDFTTRQVVASHRRLAEVSQLSTTSVRRGLLSLESEGLIAIGQWGPFGTIFTILAAPDRSSMDDAIPTSRLPPPHSGIGLPSERQRVHPAFRGTYAAADILAALDPAHPMSVGQIAKRLRRAKSTVSHWLRKFSNYGLAIREEGGYRLATSDPQELELGLDRMAETEGKFARAQRQRRRHEQERARHRARFEGRAVCDEHGMLARLDAKGRPIRCPGYAEREGRPCRFEGFPSLAELSRLGLLPGVDEAPRISETSATDLPLERSRRASGCALAAPTG